MYVPPSLVPIDLRRKGLPTTLTLDPDANSLLRAMCPNSKAMGLLVSELLRREARERADRPALLAALRNEARKID